MSHRSQAFATGVPKFTWRLERIQQQTAAVDGRYKCTCENHPAVFAFGDTEQEAMLNAQAAIESAAERVDLQLAGPSTILSNHDAVHID